MESELTLECMGRAERAQLHGSSQPHAPALAERPDGRVWGREAGEMHLGEYQDFTFAYNPLCTDQLRELSKAALLKYS
jgi:hypothetical protein